MGLFVSSFLISGEAEIENSPINPLTWQNYEKKGGKLVKLSFILGEIFENFSPPKSKTLILPQIC